MRRVNTLILTVSICLCLSSRVVTAATGKAPDSVLQKAFSEYWKASSVQKREKAAGKILATGADFSLLFRYLKSGRNYEDDVKSGRIDSRRKAGGERYHYVVLVPETYDPSRRYPVRFYLHGGILREAWRKGGRWWRDYQKFESEELISVFPSSWRHSLWWQKSQVENLAAILSELKRTYNVDEDRVYLFGISDGATGVFYQAFKASTLWAGFLAFIGHPAVLANPASGVDGELFVTNLVNKPFFIVNGEKDPLYPVVRVKPYIQLFRRIGVDLEFHSQPGGHDTEWWSAELENIECFIASHRRNPLPDRLVWQTERADRFNRIHWAVINELTSTADDRPKNQGARMFPYQGPSGRLELERRDNEVLVRTQGVKRYSLLISPDQFDLERPIKVVTNDVLSFHQKVEPNVETLVDWAARDDDRTMLYADELVIDVDSPQ